MAEGNEPKPYSDELYDVSMSTKTGVTLYDSRGRRVGRLVILTGTLSLSGTKQQNDIIMTVSKAPDEEYKMLLGSYGCIIGTNGNIRVESAQIPGGFYQFNASYFVSE